MCHSFCTYEQNYMIFLSVVSATPLTQGSLVINYVTSLPQDGAKDLVFS